jgi:hypothetical protein
MTFALPDDSHHGRSFSFLPLLSAFVSSLGFIVLLQPCLQRFTLGQSCALVSVFSAPRRFFPFINKREGARPLIVTFCNCMLAI